MTARSRGPSATAGLLVIYRYIFHAHLYWTLRQHLTHNSTDTHTDCTRSKIGNVYEFVLLTEPLSVALKHTDTANLGD